MSFISEMTLDSLIKELEIKVTNETTPEEMLQIIKKLIVAAVNSIDTKALYEVVEESMLRELRRRGFKV